MKAAVRLIEAATPAPLPTASAERFLEVAERIGWKLCRDALHAGDRCTWMSWSMEPVGSSFQPVYRTVRPSLYDGVAGIALFLAALYRFTEDRQLRVVRDGAIRSLLSRLPSYEGLPFSGYFPGPIGIGHTLATLAGWCEDERLAEAGLQLVERSAIQERNPAMLDLLSGVAGAIPVLLDLGVRHGRPGLVERAVQYGEALLEHAVESDAGVSWPSTSPRSHNLTGFSHGTAGIACALLELHQLRPDPRLWAAVQSALRYERGHFSPEHGNWPDFRLMPGAPAQPPSHPIAWCHGAGGIGLSRLRMLELLPGDEQLARELDLALRTVGEHLSAPVTPGLEDFTLCHGAAGNADLLLQAAGLLHRPALREAAERVGQRGMDLYHRPGLPWPCGVSGAGETPGLMLGTAGIGHFYLRLYEARSVPSVLLVRPARLSAAPV